MMKRSDKSEYANIRVLNIGNCDPSADDYADIEVSLCLNCHEKHDYAFAITYARLGTGELIWWHRTATCPVEYSRHGRPLQENKQKMTV